MEHMVWVAGGNVTLSKTLNFIRLMFYQIIPAVLIDLMLKFKNQRPRWVECFDCFWGNQRIMKRFHRLMGLQRKMYAANRALSYFVTNNWNFKNENFAILCSFLRLEDSKGFEYRSDFFYDQVLTIRYFILGYRRYLLKENDGTMKKCRKSYQQLFFISYVIKSALLLLAFYVSFLTFWW